MSPPGFEESRAEDAATRASVEIAGELSALRSQLAVKRRRRLSRAILEDALDAGDLAATSRAVLSYRTPTETVPEAAVILAELSRAIMSVQPQGDRETLWRLFLLSPDSEGETAGSARESVRGTMADSAWRERVEPSLIRRVAERIDRPELRLTDVPRGTRLPSRLQQVALAPPAHISSLELGMQLVLAADGLPLINQTTRRFRVEAHNLEYFPLKIVYTGRPAYTLELLHGATASPYLYDDVSRSLRVHLLDLGAVLHKGAEHTVDLRYRVVDVSDPPEPFYAVLGEDNPLFRYADITLAFPAEFPPARIWRGVGAHGEFPHFTRESHIVPPLPSTERRYIHVTHRFEGPFSAGQMYGFWWTYE